MPMPLEGPFWTPAHQRCRFDALLGGAPASLVHVICIGCKCAGTVRKNIEAWTNCFEPIFRVCTKDCDGVVTQNPNCIGDGALCVLL